jgi:hypothetical protein
MNENCSTLDKYWFYLLLAIAKEEEDRRMFDCSAETLRKL